MKVKLLFSIFFILALITCTKAGTQLLPESSYTLSVQNLNWPDPSTNEIYETSGRYIPRNIIVTRTQIYKDQAIVAMPRYKSGVPFTLGLVSLRTKGCESKIDPFPYWKVNEEENCDALQSAVDIVLDAQEILWVLDVGVINTLEQPIQKCSPKVVAIDVKTGKVNYNDEDNDKADNTDFFGN
ncbi:major royal jelly protein 4-like [Belonocnema kinseyi]|uniref:major royal jelly protein 4-like n=1 Tax=Belonocnema kinseyi TaxID=2817044 RepID=UPI00143CD6DB|nr:major royal jelly protein 4-like [Belonocnema kinseyi]